MTEASAPTASSAPTTTTTAAPTTTTEPRYTLAGSVLARDGSPVTDAVVSIGSITINVDGRGLFSVPDIDAGPVTVSRPAWVSQTVDWDGTGALDVVLEPRVVRAIRVSRYVAMDADEFAALLAQIEGTAVNTLIFDTKDETGTTLYESQVPFANEIGAIRNVYDPVAALAAAKEQGLYTMTRIVTFEDGIWTAARPEAKLAGVWVDARDPANWEYPLDLAVEACEFGFDEIQFDYVRFPTGRASQQVQRTDPVSEADRVASISSFLAEARTRLHPTGCALSAAIFGIVVSSPDDQGIGQRPEDVSAVVDAVSPMVYPSHYSPGWLGFSDPNDHPGPVTANALDDAAPRLAGHALLRPWLQAFYYNGTQVKAGIFEAETRGHGWLLWNAGGNYGESWLPTVDELPVPDLADDPPTDTTMGEVTDDQVDDGTGDAEDGEQPVGEDPPAG
ncbi:MAG: hypothetical protein OEM97_02320 [Acidimicrobiia bacterium]|nr:hypothetical protein [Acidimicrobiia bacterium]